MARARGREFASVGPRPRAHRPEVDEISAAFLVWVGVAFLAAACWGAVVVLNKKVLDYVRPIPVNFLVLVVSVTSLVVVAVPLSLLHLWPLGFAMTWAAAGYIATGSAVTWLIAFNAYYYALRSGRVGVVGPSDLHRPAVHGRVRGGHRGHDHRRPDDRRPHRGHRRRGPDLALDGRRARAPRAGARGSQRAGMPASAATVVALSLVTAAGWGFSPVMIQLAERSTGGASTTMMVLGEALGVVLLAPFVIARRTSLLIAPLQDRDRRRVVALLVGAGILNALFTVFSMS